MELVLLGTGAAAGWPNPFCTCASCTWARDAGVVRGQTAALIDGRLLVDCGPEVPRAATRLGHSLAGVRVLLLTHSHPDHLGPAALMWREWAHRDEPLTVVGPPAVIDECRRWTQAGSVSWHTVRSGDVVELDGYVVRALAANHPERTGPPVLYDIASADGRIFWGADTGPLTPDVLDATTGAAFGAVFLEESFGDGDGAPHGHLDLRTFPTAVAALRTTGAVTEATRVVAVHLGCDNPPGPELDRRLAAWGAEALPDGATVTVGSTGGSTRPRPPHRVLVLGGARSGKSAEAERRLAAEPAVTYVATARPRPDDDDWVTRVAAHVERRPSHWQTIETSDLAGVLADGSRAVLVDCMTLWLAGVVDDGDDVDKAIDAIVEAWRETPAYVVAVSNEVGSGVHPSSEVGRRFRDALGVLNARLAAEADEVWLMTAGVARRLR
jgi:adenosylcobinamide kinase/adenosylcobinamide-phosphate guanylyltransferase